MPNIDQCIILAAGNGSRLVQRSSAIPKPLVELQGRPLLEHVIGRAQEAGITNFVVVVGYRGDAIRQWVAEQDFAGITVSCIENLDYLKDNGVSVLAARAEVSGPFLLLMSDHIFDAATASALVRQPLQQDEVILAVDSNLDRVFDLDDATKVRRDGDRIIAIGKNLVDYDGFDTGMFLCGLGLFDALEAAKKGGNCSLSDGMRELGEAGKFHAFDIGDASWQDVDTPEALAYAEDIFDQFVCTTPAREEFSRA